MRGRARRRQNRNRIAAAEQIAEEERHRLHIEHQGRHRIGEIAQVAEKDRGQRNMKEPGPSPQPFIGFEQVGEDRHIAQHAQQRAAFGGGRRGCDLAARA